MNSTKSILLLLLTLTILSGFMVILTQTNQPKQLEQPSKMSYPDILVRNGNKLHLLNSSNPSAKPMLFNNLEEYKQYHFQQLKKGSDYQVIYLQEENDVQGQDVYKIYSNPFDTRIGITTMPISNNETNVRSDVVKYDKNKFNKHIGTDYNSYDVHELNLGVF